MKFYQANLAGKFDRPSDKQSTGFRS